MTLSRVVFSSASDEWATPPEVYAALHAEFDFTDDPCPIDGSAGNGLMREWGQRSFVNPPYSDSSSVMRSTARHSRVAS